METNINKYWNNIFNDYNILNKIDRDGFFTISANEIRNYKEPRLITKFDCATQLPEIMRENHIGILPITRGDYLLGKFNCFKDFPNDSNIDIKKVEFPSWIKSIDINDIYSESLAISTALISPIFNDFFGEEELVSTISGRMKSGNFNFEIEGLNITVNNSQIEIDGAIESRNKFVLIEAKNVIHDNFMIRQLYYPYRKFQQLINKPIHPIFLVYSNGIFRVLEYKFSQLERYDSLELVKEKRYSIDSTLITIKDLETVYASTRINNFDDGTPFPQCDDFNKIISLIEQLDENEGMTKKEIGQLFGFVGRQADYYFNGAKYLGFVEQRYDKIFLTSKGRMLIDTDYKTRQLRLVQAIIERPVFNELIRFYLNTREEPDKNFIESIVKNLTAIESPSTITRRSQTVKNWIKWIINLIS